jgi:nucleoside-diphosphate-sugar epimerase
MRVLFIGGTGFISTAVSRLAVAEGIELYLLNRGLRSEPPPGTHGLTADINHPEEVRAALRDLRFDVVVNWIAYTPEDIHQLRGRLPEAARALRHHGRDPARQPLLGLRAREDCL